jgi:hypothetical protein
MHFQGAAQGAARGAWIGEARSCGSWSGAAARVMKAVGKRLGGKRPISEAFGQPAA